MPLNIPDRIEVTQVEYVIEYQKKDEVLKVGAPTLDDAKALFDYLWTKTGRT